MGVYDRVFTRESKIGHAERNAKATKEIRKANAEINVQFAAINIDKALTILEGKKWNSQ